MRHISCDEHDVEHILHKLLSKMNALEQQNDWPAIHREFQQCCIFMGEVIGFGEEQKKYSGIAQRIDEEGFFGCKRWMVCDDL